MIYFTTVNDSIFINNRAVVLNVGTVVKCFNSFYLKLTSAFKRLRSMLLN